MDGFSHANFLASLATFAEYSNRTACPSNGPNWTSIMTKADSQACGDMQRRREGAPEVGDGLPEEKYENL